MPWCFHLVFTCSLKDLLDFCTPGSTIIGAIIGPEHYRFVSPVTADEDIGFSFNDRGVPSDSQSSGFAGSSMKDPFIIPNRYKGLS
jgi:hypothetical protein